MEQLGTDGFLFAINKVSTARRECFLVLSDWLIKPRGSLHRSPRLEQASPRRRSVLILCQEQMSSVNETGIPHMHSEGVHSRETRTSPGSWHLHWRDFGVPLTEHSLRRRASHRTLGKRCIHLVPQETRRHPSGVYAGTARAT